MGYMDMLSLSVLPMFLVMVDCHHYIKDKDIGSLGWKSPDSKQSVDKNNVKSRNLHVEWRVSKGDHEVVQLKLKYSDKTAGA
ncbi:hypothetical protein ARMGADRAFT_1018983 [Armillaria gallica]|uniref:Uncharacterized protein n=1 Tax=Armillaria gallica TaxID=47427 RepID=A0A2H3CKM7_ARMGA|nr:hypothetical protein ARMGADRAFT_1018983 [Armillaria gallica]